jgi:hypothetical protein
MTRVWRSPDGERWDASRIDAVQTNGIAFGNDRYVATGNGPFAVSTDGEQFQSVSLDCTVAGACRVDPSLMVHQASKRGVVFVGGAFFAEAGFIEPFGALRSVDGEEWSEVALADAPQRALGDYFLRWDGEAINVFRDIEPTRRRVPVTTERGDRTCATHRCFILEGFVAGSQPAVRMLVLVP